MNSSSREWDAETYDRVSDPQFSWGMEVLERLELRGDEVVVDAGCGSGRVSAELKRKLLGGRLVAQCGGEGNVAKHVVAIAAVAARPEFAQHFGAASSIWNFAGPEETEERLRGAGFTEVRCWLEPKRFWPRPSSRWCSTTSASTSRHGRRMRRVPGP